MKWKYTILIGAAFLAMVYFSWRDDQSIRGLEAHVKAAQQQEALLVKQIASATQGAQETIRAGDSKGFGYGYGTGTTRVAVMEFVKTNAAWNEGPIFIGKGWRSSSPYEEAGPTNGTNAKVWDTSGDPRFSTNSAASRPLTFVYFVSIPGKGGDTFYKTRVLVLPAPGTSVWYESEWREATNYVSRMTNDLGVSIWHDPEVIDLTKQP